MPIAAVVVGLVFVLTQLTGSDVDEQVAQTVGTMVALVVFMAIGSAGVALAHWQPRFTPLGAMATTLSLLACGAAVVLIWSNTPSFFFFSFDGTSGLVAAITELLALTSAAACVLLATMRRGEDTGTRLVRGTAIGSLLVLVGLAILEIVDHGVDISPRVYGILATVFVIASAAVLVLRLLPLADSRDS